MSSCTFGGRIAAVLLLLVCTGCGGSADTSEVSGTVTVAGQPLPKGAISFFPAGGGRPISGAVDEAGAYQVRVPPGDYTVVVQASMNLPEGWKEGDPVPPQPVKVPLQYTQRNNSPLTVTVAEREALERDFEL